MKRVVAQSTDKVDPSKLNYKPFKKDEEYAMYRTSGDTANRTMKVVQVSHKAMKMKIQIVGSEKESSKIYKTLVCDIRHKDGAKNEYTVLPFDLRMYLNVSSTDPQLR